MRLSAWPVLLLFWPIVGRAFAQISTETASCQERCDEDYFPGKPCYCNAACDQYENCCYDYYEICAPDQVWVDDWVEHDSHLYKFFRDQTASGAEAADLCKQHGALLASINSQSEMEFIGEQVLRKRTLGAFTGGLRGEDNTWRWADGSAIATPSDEWNEWYDGHPADGDCSVVTNYKFWDVSKFKLDSYQWRSFSCDVNVGKTIPGYICEATVLCSSNPCQNNGTCSYVGELTKSGYTCSCLDGFLGEHCQYQVEDGEPWTFCGDTVLTAPQGIISSPLYPQSYPPNVRCQWLIQVEANKTISLLLDSLVLEFSKDCVFDKVLIYDGPSKNDTLLKEPLCGYLHENLNTSQMITSSTNEVLIEMQTDYSVQKAGFHMSYAQQDCGLGTGDSGCGTRRKFTSACGSIEILNPNDHGATCQLDIIAPAGHIVNLTVVEFYTPESDQECLDSYVAFHDSDKADDTLLGRYCGWRFPWSLQSSGSELHVTVNTSATDWVLGSHRVEMRYQFVETATWRRLNHDVMLADGDGTWSSRDYPVQVMTSEHVIQEWIVRVPIGERLKITWSASFQASTTSSLEIYDGFSAESGHLLHIIDTSSGEVMPSSFQARVRFTRALNDNTSDINIDYQTLAWVPELSGCYRPLYHDQTSTPETENNLVTTLEPVTVMVSEGVYGSKNTPSYGPGLYCKWRIQAGSEVPGLALSFLDAVIPPLTENCDYDGLVVYGPKLTIGTKYGPFCGGKRENKGTTFQDLVFAEEEDIVVVFYSDRRLGEREGGIVRAVVTPSDLGECRVDAMDKETSNVMDSACGTVLSPAFPGLVQPGQWLWTIQGPPGAYFNVYVFYIRGPGLPADEDCRQSFTVLEISQDSGLLRQNEAHLMRVCGDTDLFVPAERLKMPPHQKVGLELNMATSRSAQQWQFKIGYKSDVMSKPKHTEDAAECPEDYVSYNNYCYRYYPWVLRHYRDEYSFTETWQKSLEHCEKENATLLSVKDEEEAYFVKHTFTDAWFWDPASSFQQNHRMIFMGLHNKYGKYEWTDGTALSYANWYVPYHTWQQPVLHEDTEGTSFLNLQKSQPTADIGSLCTAIIVTSPFRSLHWAKIPCDYPIFRAGAICKKPAIRARTDTLRPQGMSPFSVGPITVCPEGWLMIAGRCLHLYTDYTAARMAMKMGPDSSITFSRDNATSTCDNLGGHLAEVSHSFLGHLVMYFKIWRVTPEMGSTWISSEGNSSCRVIEVAALHSQDEDYQYTVRKTPCSIKQALSVLCETDTIQRVEECAAHEFRCSDGECISVDRVCDGHDDCATGSDEQNCGCGVDSFTCENGRCIPVSLYCDFIDHCGDNSDEENCQLQRCGPDEFQCRSGQCVPETARCDFKLQCSDASDEDASLCDNQCQGLLCYSGHCLHPKLQSDLISDCPGMSGEDELENTDGLITFFDLLINGVSISNDTTHFGCEAGGQSQCRTNHERCYNRADTCVYDTERIDERSLIPVQASCRDGAHLRAECEAVSCPGKYHCQGSYCLPVRKLCDGIPDCPLGDDEQGCDNFTCPGMLRCKAGGTCVPHSEVCDGIPHCPVYGEDEKYCQAADPLCSTPGCSCTGLVATCSNLAATDLAAITGQGETRTLRALVITGSTLQLTTRSFRKLHWLAKLVLNHNRIDVLPSGVFADLRNLYELDLSQNDIRVLDANVFNGLDSLTHLYLNDNKLNSLNSAILEPLVKLKHLNLKQNGFSDVKKDTFQYSKSLRVLHSDDYKFCCIASQVETCTPEADEFSSCEDLMANYALQVSIWVLGFMAFLGNIFVIGWRILKDRSRPSSFFIINLSCSDLLMGMYLLIIASVDVYYRGTYILHAESWRSSVLCQFAGILAMLSSEVSVFMLTAITMDRVVSIAFPLKFGQIRMKQARIVAAFTWSFCIILSLLPVSGIGYFGDSFFGRTGVCLPFQISNDRLPGWEYSVFIFLVLNFISFIVILIGYVAIFLTVKSSVKRFGGSATATTDEYALAKKVSLIVATDFLCWVPIILIGFAALGGAQISPRVSAWIAVFVLPLNSSLNPLLYTISSLDCRSKRRRQAGHANSSVSDKTCSTVATTTKQPAHRYAYSADSDTASEMKAIKIGVTETDDKQKAAPPTYDEAANEA